MFAADAIRCMRRSAGGGGGGGVGVPWSVTDSNPDIIFSEDGYLFQNAPTAGHRKSLGDMPSRKSTGKYYAELEVVNFGGSRSWYFGFVDIYREANLSTVVAGVGCVSYGGNGAYALDNNTVNNQLPIPENGDVIAIAVDLTPETWQVSFYHNGIHQLTLPPRAGYADRERRLAMSAFGANAQFRLRSSSDDFIYTPPAGYDPWGYN